MTNDLSVCILLCFIRINWILLNPLLSRFSSVLRGAGPVYNPPREWSLQLRPVSPVQTPEHHECEVASGGQALPPVFHPPVSPLRGQSGHQASPGPAYKEGTHPVISGALCENTLECDKMMMGIQNRHYFRLKFSNSCTCNCVQFRLALTLFLLQATTFLLLRS